MATSTRSAVALILDLDGRAAMAVVRWGPGVHQQDIRTDRPEDGAPVSRADDVALWHEVNRTIIRVTGVVEMFAKRVRDSPADDEDEEVCHQQRQSRRARRRA